MNWDAEEVDSLVLRLVSIVYDDCHYGIMRTAQYLSASPGLCDKLRFRYCFQPHGMMCYLAVSV